MCDVNDADIATQLLLYYELDDDWLAATQYYFSYNMHSITAYHSSGVATS